MPRAERRKRENRKLLITSAKKIPKIYSFLKSKCSVSAEAEDDIGVNVTTAQCICEPTSKTTASATVTVRAVARTLIGGGGVYSYIRVLPD